MSDTLGSLVSEFVRERTATPDYETLDLWVEAVAAGLFSVGIRLVLLPQEAKESPEAMERCCNQFCQEAAASAGLWMNELSQPKRTDTTLRGGSITFDFRDRILSSLVSYFDIYFRIMEESELSHKEARARSLSIGLGFVSNALDSRRFLGGSYQSPWIQQVLEQCRLLVQDLPEYAR